MGSDMNMLPVQAIDNNCKSTLLESRIQLLLCLVYNNYYNKSL